MEKIKIEFFEDDEWEKQEYEATSEELKQIFEIAEKLTDKDLKRLEQMCSSFNPENETFLSEK